MKHSASGSLLVRHSTFIFMGSLLYDCWLRMITSYTVACIYRAEAGGSRLRTSTTSRLTNIPARFTTTAWLTAKAWEDDYEICV